MEELQASAYGSVFDTITTATFQNIEIALPDIREVNAFEENTTQYFHKILANTKQISALTQIRDTLLPKLMSGEVKLGL